LFRGVAIFSGSMEIEELRNEKQGAGKKILSVHLWQFLFLIKLGKHFDKRIEVCHRRG